MSHQCLTCDVRQRHAERRRDGHRGTKGQRGAGRQKGGRGCRAAPGLRTAPGQLLREPAALVCKRTAMSWRWPRPSPGPSPAVYTRTRWSEWKPAPKWVQTHTPGTSPLPDTDPEQGSEPLHSLTPASPRPGRQRPSHSLEASARNKGLARLLGTQTPTGACEVLGRRWAGPGCWAHRTCILALPACYRRTDIPRLVSEGLGVLESSLQALTTHAGHWQMAKVYTRIKTQAPHRLEIWATEAWERAPRRERNALRPPRGRASTPQSGTREQVLCQMHGKSQNPAVVRGPAAPTPAAL